MKFKYLDRFADFINENAYNYRRALRWALALLVALTIILLYQFNAFERLELLTLDYRFILRQAKHDTGGIVFIDMAEDSIDAIGRWPWPRKWHAALIKIVSEYKPRAIAFDVLFSEPQDELDDTALEEAMRQSKDVYLPILYNLKFEDAKYLYKGYGIDSVTMPLPIFAKESKGMGHINAVPDIDGILRRAPAIIHYKDLTTYQFGLKIGFDILGVDADAISFYPERHLITYKTAGGKTMKMPLDNHNRIIINWRGVWGKEFPHYSCIDIIKSYALIKEGKKPIVDLTKLTGQICIVGLTASGLIDIKPVPIQNAYPAVGVNAMILSSALNHDYIYNLPKIYNVFIIILISIVTTLYFSNLRLFSGVASAIAAMICYALFSALIFNFFNIAILTFYPILAVFFSYSLTSIYTQILQSIERARLFKQATRDGLTSLYNIRHFNLLLEAEFKNVATYKSRRLSILMADVDNFKKLNDNFGHQAGDAVLKELGKMIQLRCRQTDVAARYGGEEFIVMLSGAAQKDAYEVAEKMRSSFEAKAFKFKNTPCTITISIGVAEYSDEKNKDELIAKADKALYKAKRDGKNRACIYSPSADK